MRRHELDLLSLLSGLGFIALGVVFLAGWFDASVLRLRWIGAGLLLVLGLGLLLSTRSHTPRRADDAEEPGSGEPSASPDQSPRPTDK